MQSADEPLFPGLKEWLGHESLETLKHYAKLTITDLPPSPPTLRRGKQGHA